MKKTNKKSGVLLLVGMIILAMGIYFATRTEQPAVSDPVVSVPETPPAKTPTPSIDSPPSTMGAGAAIARGAGLEIGMPAGDAENKIEDLLKPDSSEGQTYDVRRTPETPGGYTLIATADNMLDDSLKAQEITAIFRPNAEKQLVLSELQSRIKCRRGDNAGQWTLTRCP